MRKANDPKALILLIDDEVTWTADLVPCLEQDGYEVEVRVTVEAGLAVARRHVPHLIILDLGIPVHSENEPGTGTENMVFRQLATQGWTGGQVFLHVLRQDPAIGHIQVMVYSRAAERIEYDELTEPLDKSSEPEAILTQIHRAIEQVKSKLEVERLDEVPGPRQPTSRWKEVRKRRKGGII